MKSDKNTVVSEKDFNYILVNGYGWSGSSAVIDLFKEFSEVYVPEKEFRLLKDPFGIIDLDRSLTDPIEPLNEDIALRNFIWFTDKYINKAGGFRPNGLSYCVDFGKDIKRLTQEYVESLTDYVYHGYWWFLELHYPYLKYILFKILRRLKIYNSKNHHNLRLYNKTEDEFLYLTKKYINGIFEHLLKDGNYNYVVLDQAVPAKEHQLAGRYFKNAKTILVDRDPRDTYIDLINEKSLVGYDVALHHNVQLFIDFFKKMRKEKVVAGENVLRLRFEELVLNYEETLNRIIEFTGLNAGLHKSKKAFFDPDVSKKNIGLYKSYGFQEEIRLIEQQLGEFCFA